MGPLAPGVRQFIVLLALVQGLLLYLASRGEDNGWWPWSLLGGRVCWYALVLSVPSAMLLSVRDLREARFWQHAALVALVFALLGAWAAWSATGEPSVNAGAVLAPFSMSMGAALFVALPYLQCRQLHERWCAPYPQLFELAWQNALTLLLTALFVGICWAVLWLWGALFRLIGIDFFAELFGEQWFIYLATGVMVGLGILIGRTQQRPVQVARRILFAIFTGLLPLLAVVSLLFIASLPFTGLQPLWQTRSAAITLMSVVGVMVLFTNAVYQDGDDPLPYPRWLRRVVDAGLLALPLFALLALYAMGLRIGQHGWTQERLAGVIASLILAGHAFGYAWAVLRPRGEWLSRLRPVNVLVSLLAIAVTLLVNSPLLDPHRLAVSSQLARLADGRTPPAEFDVDFLRFETGRRGVAASRALAADPALESALGERIVRALERSERWYTQAERERLVQRDDNALRERIAVVGEATSLPDSWWQALAGGRIDLDHDRSCRLPGADCVAIVRDLDGDGLEDVLLCNLMEQLYPTCRLAAGDGWQRAVAYDFHTFEPAMPGRRAMSGVVDALRRGEVTPAPRRWPDLDVAGARGRTNPYEGDGGE
ncbi:MAG: DUF4153 domain-containing protein [Pseudoxanthomonas suwonensis]|nr:DUF4153 domain-containing protein [Pseudoxanthomonas suwonensis]